MTRKAPTWLTRDLVLFVAGLLGIGYETVFEHFDRPTLLIIFGSMSGLPLFLRVDEGTFKKPKSGTPPDPPSPP